MTGRTTGRTTGLLDRASGWISVAAVLGLLAGAIVVAADVLMRWTTGSAVVALNEVMAQVFAIAAAATLPLGARRRVNLTVDLTAPWIGTRLGAWLAVVGAALLALFFAVLAAGIWATGVKFHAQGRETLILQWPLAPTCFVVAAMLWLSTALQAVHVVGDIRAALAAPNVQRIRWPGLLHLGARSR